MRIGSLFSGIGGLELGLEAALGWETAWTRRKRLKALGNSVVPQWSYQIGLRIKQLAEEAP